MRQYPLRTSFTVGAVHLVYCVSGIETRNLDLSLCIIIVHLVYCVSGIETA